MKIPTDGGGVSPDQLKQWRIKRHLTQKECAELAGINVRSWQKWEYGKCRIPSMLKVMVGDVVIKYNFSGGVME